QRLHIEEEDFTVDLNFTPRAPAFRDGDGRIYLDQGKKDYMDVTYQPYMDPLRLQDILPMCERKSLLSYIRPI
ncbi:MAG: hypothetical protein RPU14_09575, partial [Candidatus Sedimenticola sp. (ex Thyasira tokunagai)]